jgi:hypothetical protein
MKSRVIKLAQLLLYAVKTWKDYEGIGLRHSIVLYRHHEHDIQLQS